MQLSVIYDKVGKLLRGNLNTVEVTLVCVYTVKIKQYVMFLTREQIDYKIDKYTDYTALVKNKQIAK